MHLNRIIKQSPDDTDCAGQWCRPHPLFSAPSAVANSALLPWAQLILISLLYVDLSWDTPTALLLVLVHWTIEPSELSELCDRGAVTGLSSCHNGCNVNHFFICVGPADGGSLIVCSNHGEAEKVEPGGAFPLCYPKGPFGPQEKGCGGVVCEQPAWGPPVPHLADRRGGGGLAAAPHLLAMLQVPPGSLAVLFSLLLVCRWWERGFGRPPFGQSRPPSDPLRPR